MTHDHLLNRTAAAVMFLTVVGLALTACSSGSSPSASGTTTPVHSSSAPASAAPTITVTEQQASQPQTGSASPTSTAAQSVDCAESQLRASIDPRHIPGDGTQNAKGVLTKAVFVDFENTSSRTCVLTGYPGAATVNAAGKQITQATRTLRGSLGGLAEGTSTFPRVTLAAGHYAAAMIEGVDQKEAGAAQAGCDASLPRILVTPPNNTVPVPFTVSWPVCYSFTVHPVQALPDAP